MVYRRSPDAHWTQAVSRVAVNSRCIETVHTVGSDTFKVNFYVTLCYGGEKVNDRLMRLEEVLEMCGISRSLTVYRMVFGQPRQEDFLEFILRQVPEERREEVAAALTVDLSPPNMLE